MGGINFVAIDTETANADQSSICQIGFALVRDGEISRTQSLYLNPCQAFNLRNIAIHGITADHVRDEPTFVQRMPKLLKSLEPLPIVSHGNFDRSALTKAMDANNIPLIEFQWLDSKQVAQKCWPELPNYKLDVICENMKIVLEKHHDAEHDAAAAAQVVIRACNRLGVGIDDWFDILSNPTTAYFSKGKLHRTIQGNPTGKYHGLRIVFTGDMRLPRDEVKTLAQSHGFTVATSVSKKVDYLCLGDVQDTSQFAGYAKSRKHRDAEALVEAGLPLKIISEDEFIAMIDSR